jgi:hypothetical protein
MAKFLLCFLLQFFYLPNSFAQQFKIIGRVTNTKLEPLSFATIQLKNSEINTTAKQDGTFQLELEKGRYEIVISLVGYKAQVIAFVLNKNNDSLNVILEENFKMDEAAMVIGQRKDRSEELIRNVIRNKESIISKINSFSANIYIKAIQENARTKAPVLKNSKDSINAAAPNMSMAEVQMQLDFQVPNKIKETRNGVKRRGNPENLFYMSNTEGDFSLYKNLMHIKGIGPTPFLSPISYSGLVAYKYKTIRTRKENARTIYTITFKPTLLGNALLTGEVEVMDSIWVIISSKFTLPNYHLVEYDNFEVEQEYQYVQDTAWLLKKQKFTYFAKQGKTNLNGTTTVYYNSYELNKQFPKKHFGVELSSTSKEAYKRDSVFWQAARTEPLTDKELKFIRYKDSLLQVTTSQKYYDSIDAKTNKITAKKVLLDGLTFYNRKKERTINIGSIANLYEPIGIGGTRLGYNAFYSKTFENKKNIWMNSIFSYGLRNKDFNGTFSFNRMYNPFNRGYISGSIGRDFGQLFEGDVAINAIQKRNVYRKYSFSVAHGLELLNGLFLRNELELAKRESIVGFKFDNFNKYFSDTATLNFFEKQNTPQYFEPHNAFYNNITLSYTPFQQYMREPLQKVILGSKWPTFTALWRKGVPNFLGSVINYDYVELKMSQTINIGTVGISRYSVKVGTFPNRDSIPLADKKYMRGRDPYLFFFPEGNFQHLDSTFELKKPFLEAHYIHEFNGAILNKIPLLKKLQLRESAGGGFLIAPERNLKYFEAFVGIEGKPFRILKDRFKVGLFVVGSTSKNNPVQLKLSIRQWDLRNNRWQ